MKKPLIVILSILLLNLVGCTITVSPSNTKATERNATESTITTVPILPTENVTTSLTESVTEYLTIDPITEITTVPVEYPTSVTEITTEKATNPLAKNTTENSTESNTEEISVETVTNKATEVNNSDYRYGKCIKTTPIIVKSDFNLNMLYEDQNVTIIDQDSTKDCYLILWYEDVAYVQASTILLYPDNYEPTFESGQWAGSIHK